MDYAKSVEEASREVEERGRQSRRRAEEHKKDCLRNMKQFLKPHQVSELEKIIATNPSLGGNGLAKIRNIFLNQDKEEAAKLDSAEHREKLRKNLTPEKLNEIEKKYQNKIAVFKTRVVKQCYPYYDDRKSHFVYVYNGQYLADYIEEGERPLTDMSRKEKAILCAAEMMHCGGVMPYSEYQEIRHLMVFNGGKNGEVIYDFYIHGEEPEKCDKAHVGFTKALNALNAYLATKPDDLLAKRLERLFKKGKSLMELVDIPTSKILSNKPSPYNIFLGNTEQTPVFYNGDKGILTLAPQGSGKSLCGIIPNLKRFQGSAVVLDIKGECYDYTAEIRKNFGRVFIFDLDDPKASHSYNPLAQLSRDPFELWRDAEYMANLLIPPSQKGYNQWDDMAKKYVRLVVAYVLIEYKNPSMDEVFALTAGEDVEKMLARIMADKKQGEHKYLKSMHQVAKKYWDLLKSAKAGNSDAQWNGLLSTANDALEQWNDEYVRHITTHSDWKPEDIRETGTTLYIRVSEETLKAYNSVLRAIIGQLMRALQRRGQQEIFETTQAPIFFFLDEFTALGEIEEFPAALERGRSRGLRLWLVTQSFQQMRKAFPNSYETLHDLSGVEMYMQPNDKDAQAISKRLGTQENIMDGKAEPILTPAELSGRKCENKIIAFVRGEDALIMDRVFDSDIDYSCL